MYEVKSNKPEVKINVTCVNSHFYSSFPFHWQYQHCPQWHPPTIVRKRFSSIFVMYESHTRIFVMYERKLIIRNWLMQLWRLEEFKICRTGLQCSRRPREELQFKSTGNPLAEFLLVGGSQSFSIRAFN